MKLVRHALLLLPLAAIAFFFFRRIAAYIDGRLPTNFGESLLSNRLWFIGHIIGGVIILLVGLSQFFAPLRNGYPQIHRRLGKIYIFGSIIAAGFVLVLIPQGECSACRPSQYVVTTLWLLFTVLAWLSIRRWDISSHWQFMVRSYICAFYFVSIRVLDEIGLERLFPYTTNEGVRYANSDWLAWLVPLLVAEFIISWWPILRPQRSSAS